MKKLEQRTVRKFSGHRRVTRGGYAPCSPACKTLRHIEPWVPLRETIRFIVITLEIYVNVEDYGNPPDVVTFYAASPRLCTYILSLLC